MHVTIKAFPCRVDDGEVVAGASSNNQVKWSPLLNLTKKNNNNNPSGKQMFDETITCRLHKLHLNE